MKKTSRFKLGDVFRVPLPDGRVGYFQYIAKDATQLNSEVIRLFDLITSDDTVPDIRSIMASEVIGYAHIFIQVGSKMGYWTKVGSGSIPESFDVVFRDSHDYGDPTIKVSRRWVVWRINEPFLDIGELTPQYQDSEIGIVVSPPNIPERILNGSYIFSYPRF